MVAVAWKWPSRWPELAAGVVFVVCGIALLVCILIVIVSAIASPGVYRLGLGILLGMLIDVCVPVAIGVLFILAYRRGLAKN
jgi:hypothetical protein